MNTSVKKHFITIKGTKDGLTILLDDQCSFQELLKELEEKVKAETKAFGSGPEVAVKVDAGYRYLDDSHRQKITDILEQAGSIKVESIESKVLSYEDMKKEKQERAITPLTKIIRSGQIVRIDGDALLIGDVNPGGTIEATGSIYVMGTLKGTARSGTKGRRDTVVCASVMDPTQISIESCLYFAPEKHESGKEMEAHRKLQEYPVYAYINEKDGCVSFQKTRQLGQFHSHAVASLFDQE